VRSKRSDLMILS